MIKLKLRPLRNQKGSAIYIAVVTSGLLLLGLRVAYDMSMNSTRLSRANRVKIAMNGTDAKLRSLAYDPSSYSDCNSMASGRCNINPATIAQLKAIVPGAKCDSNPAPDVCGIDIQNAALVQNPGATAPDTFTADIVYTGNELPLAPIKVSMVIPKEVLQASSYRCPASRPLFAGYNSDYKIN